MKINCTKLIIFIFSFLPLLSFADEQSKALTQLKFDLHRLKDDFDIPAMAVVIVDADRVLLTDVSGFANRLSKKTASADTIFRIGSITKMFTSLAILMLQEDGLLKLDQNVNAFIPPAFLQNKWHATHPIKISHLLEHTAGLRDLSKAEFDHNKPMSLENALRWKSAQRRSFWPPGLHYSYTNVGAGLAAYVIEKTSQQEYESFVKKRIFTPLGMLSASFENDDSTLTNLATGYDSDGITVIPYWHVFYRAFGAINIRPVELAPFLQLLIRRGEFKGQRLLSEAAIERMERPETTLAAKSGLSFGYGLGNYSSQRNGLVFHGHGGDADGYLSRLAYNRETNLAYFIVINTFKNSALSALTNRTEGYISRHQLNQESTPYKINMRKLSRYSGLYRRITSRFPSGNGQADELKMSVNDGILRINDDNGSKILIPVNDLHFRLSGESKATSAFYISDKDQIFFQGPGGNYLQVEK